MILKLKNVKAVKRLIFLFSIVILLMIIIGVSKKNKETQKKMVNNNEENIAADSKSLEQLRLYAQAAVLMDADSGRVLYEKNAQEELAMASTTKIMTLIVTLENADLNDIVSVSSYAASMPDVQLNIRTGERYRLADLLYSLMLESHNDTAVAIAEHVGTSVEQFAAMMNKKAEEIGCENTWFITPNGLDATANYADENGELINKTHHTTAKDLAKIMSYCITKSPAKEKFIEITQTASYSFGDVDNKRSFTCINHNAFLNMMAGALSGKTGFTSKAGYCYVGALKQENRTFVVALLACGWPNHKTYKWSDTKQLMEYGLKNYQYYDFSQVKIPKEAQEPIVVKNAKTEKVGEEAFVEVKFQNKDALSGVLINETEKVEVSLQREKELEAPVQEGAIVGTLYFLIGNEKWKTYQIVAAKKVEKIDFEWCVEQVFRYWCVGTN